MREPLGNEKLSGHRAGLQSFDKYRELFPGLLTLAVFATFVPAMITGVRLTMDASVRYWAGWKGAFVLLIPVILVVCHMVQAYYRKPVFFAVLAGTVGPAMVAIAVGMIVKSGIEDISMRLTASDCTSYDDKWELEEAYRRAELDYSQCIARLTANSTNDTVVEAIRRSTFLGDCDEFINDPMRRTYQRHWNYLAGLETTEDCSGWCGEGQQAAVFTGNPAAWDTCSGVVGHDLFNKVGFAANRMMATGGIGFLLAAGAIFLIQEWMNHTKDPTFTW